MKITYILLYIIVVMVNYCEEPSRNNIGDPQSKFYKYIDKENPALEIISHKDGFIFGIGTYYIQGTASDNIQLLNIGISVDGDEFQPSIGKRNWSFEFNTTTLSEGEHALTFQATDTSGNKNIKTLNVIVNKTIPSAIVLDVPNNPTNSTELNVTISGKNIESYKYKLDANEWSNEIAIEDNNILITNLYEGEHQIKVIGKNVYQTWQVQNNSYTYTWIVDITGPIVHLTGLPAAQTNSDSLIITVTGTDVISYKYNIDNGGYGPESDISEPILESLLSEGQHSLVVIGKDSAGNWQDIEYTEINYWIVDTEAPIATIFGAPSSPSIKTDIMVYVSGPDLINYKYKLDGAPWSNELSYFTPINETGLSPGMHMLQVIGKDLNNNWQDTAFATTWNWTIQ